MTFLRQLWKQKPQAWGPFPAVQSALFHNLERIGIDPQTCQLAMPMWGPGDQYDYSKNSIIGSLGSSMSYENNKIVGGSTYDDHNNRINLGTTIDPLVWSGITCIVDAYWIEPGTEQYPGIISNVLRGEYYTNYNLTYEYDTGPSDVIIWRPGDNATGIRISDVGLDKTHAVVAASWIKQGAANIYLNGINRAAGTIAADWGATNVTTYVNGYFRVTYRAGENKYKSILIFNYALNETQIASISDNPYQLWQPVPQKTIFLPIGGGSTLLPIMMNMNQFNGGIYETD